MPYDLPDFSGMNSYELTRRLREQKPVCPVCQERVDPDAEPCTILAVPIAHPTQFDLMGLMPVHDRCKAEAMDRMSIAQKRLAGVVN